VTTELPPTHATGPVCPQVVVPGTGARIAIIDVDGLLLNYPMVGMGSMGENPVALFRERLEAAAADPCVRAVVVRINSHGGGVTASDIMRRDLLAFKARKGVPVVACLMDVAAGGAYYLATAADQIVAHPTAVTGGIGVILNLYKLDDTMALTLNAQSVAIRAGEKIDMGSPLAYAGRELGDEVDQGRQLLQEIADEYHRRFIEAVQSSRPVNDPTEAIYDGRVFTAPTALAYGLVDRLGYVDDAVALARDLASAPGACVVLYHRSNDRARTLYAVTPNVPLQSTLLPMSVPGLERSKLPTFLYLWQPEPSMERLGGR
jgi:protease-4